MHKKFFQDIFNIAVAAADPYLALKKYLPKKPQGRTIIIGAGKGVAQMAAALEKLWHEAGNGEVEGLVVTRYGYATPCNNITVVESSHPVPDENGLIAAQKLLESVNNLSEDDLVIALICGGGSALLPLPPLGMSLNDDILLNKALLASGAPIDVMNAIRKHFSQIKGGRLAKAASPAKVVSLIVSDIPGDEPSFVSSGPTVANHISKEQARAYISQYKIALPDHIIAYFANDDEDAPLPNDPAFQRNEVHVIASARQSLLAAKQFCENAGFSSYILSDAIEGEAREIAKMHGAIAKEIALFNQPFQKPAILLSGGETTVTISQSDIEAGAKGGRNSEFLLSLALTIKDIEGIYGFAADTDGIDGSENNAGAFCDFNTIAAMQKAGIDGAKFLAQHNAWSAFNAIDNLFVPGPTGTNVNDLRIILIK
ncbi:MULTISPECIES: glycerate kinase type-2 family protein [unclassified Bartonella]|uniref:glycerate kinase type-2 family protein n=1 Tax=unclassified Bartonella TaxID=2645622 RepID=UPI0021C7B45C|nr:MULTISPECIES: glycerate kinase [unclassified Bartonella]UXN04169.1 glycerate kinase [Bartonella sp. HY406]UXN07158.1 glycerate kinase [Bartonella sp. HY761]